MLVSFTSAPPSAELWLVRLKQLFLLNDGVKKKGRNHIIQDANRKLPLRSSSAISKFRFSIASPNAVFPLES